MYKITKHDQFETYIRNHKVFAHFPENSDVNEKTKSIPERAEVLINSSPHIMNGTIVFAVKTDGSLVWIGQSKKEESSEAQ